MGAAGASALLLLADGRFPAGGHAHSAGVESAVADGRVHDLASLDAYVRGRLRSAGVVDAALAVATWQAVGTAVDEAAQRAALVALEAQASARLPAEPLRRASRRLGRQLARVSARCWPSAALATLVDVCPEGAHLSVAFGVVGLAAGLDAPDLALLVAHHTLTTPAQAAVRLLGLDPFACAALTARLGTLAAEVAGEAAVAGRGPLDELPARSGPVVDIAAVEHPGWDLRLFAT